jgi:hypothetical protein
MGVGMKLRELLRGRRGWSDEPAAGQDSCQNECSCTCSVVLRLDISCIELNTQKAMGWSLNNERRCCNR